ncbi:hypothetical protein DD924_10645, partial [Staphylococcus pseudintermedius]
MKKSIVLLLGLSLVLSACGPDEDESKSSKEKTEAQQRDHNKVKEIATDKNVQGTDYRTILPFKESQARGLIQENMANSYNGEDFEDGLLNISKEVYPTDEYLYQDGQY